MMDNSFQITTLGEIMNKYITNFSRSAIDHWDNHEAVRELIQNFLDSDGEQFHSLTENTLVLGNKNTTVSNKIFMMGMSTKKDDPNKRGKFGTGSCFALCVLTARGISVEIQNNNVMWTPRFEHCGKFQEDVMVIDEVDFYPSDDFIVTISGLSEDDINDIKQTNLIFQDRVVVSSTKYGDIIESVDEFGEVYCGDLFVKQAKGFSYSYNIKPSHLKLNQDRDSISEWELQNLTAKMIMSSGNEKLIKEAIDSKTLDCQHVAYDWNNSPVPSNISDSYAEEFVDEHEATFITSEYSEHEYNQLHNTPSVYIDNKVKVSTIKQSTVYKESVANIEVVEQASPCEVVEKCKEEIMEILCANMKAESCSEVLSLLDSLVELSDHWGGDIDWDSVPF